MSVNKSTVESVDLTAGGEISIYITDRNRVALTITIGNIESCVWITQEDLKGLVETINKAQEEFNGN